MAESIAGFYDELAASYHLIFEDWDAAIDRQARRIDSLLRTVIPSWPLRILDCACGIGTQSLGLAALGHRVSASDLSTGAVERARREAALRGLTIPFSVSDMTSLREVPESGFDAVIAMDNALPHLSTAQLRRAAAAIRSKLRPGGLFIASMRDYDALIQEKPIIQKPVFYGAPGSRRIVHQVWDWVTETSYVLHVYITLESEQGWEARHFVSHYRCLQREELSRILADAGFHPIRWLMPPESGSNQSIVLARRPG
jgi:SAM-dependent methyltransferase